MASRAAFRRRSATASQIATTAPMARAIAEIRDDGTGVAGESAGTSATDDVTSPSSAREVFAPVGAERDHRTGNVDNAAGCRSHVTAMTATNAASARRSAPAGLPREHPGEHEPHDPQRHRELDDDVVGVEDDRHPVGRRGLLLRTKSADMCSLDRSVEAPEAPSEHGALG